MNTTLAATTLALLAALPLSANAAQPADSGLAPSQAALEPMLGTWLTDTTFAGQPFVFKTQVEPGLGGQFAYRNVLIETFGDFTGMEVFTVIRAQPDGSLLYTDFRSDGTVRDTVMHHQGGSTYTFSSDFNGTPLEESLTFGDTIQWTATTTTEDGESTTLADAEAVPAEPFELSERPATLAPPVADLSRFLGEWTIDATWADGTSLNARNTFTVGLNGHYLEARTFANDNNQGEYERYFSIYAFDQETQQYIGHGFDFAGTYKPVPFELEEDGRIMKLESPMTDAPNAPVLRQQIEFTSDNTYRWQVWMQMPGSDSFSPMMDGTWHRVGSQADSD